MNKLFFTGLILIGFISCNKIKIPENPNVPNVPIDITIYPNSTEYWELNTVSGWMYITSLSPSRGIIVYRYSIDEFRAYERMAPNEPDACGEKSRLVVELPFVVDTCLDIKYNILNGDILFPENYQGYNLTQYHTQYNGTTLRIFN